MFYVYIIECTSKKGIISYYTGYTQDLFNRFSQHRNGKGAKYTKGKDLKLVYFEQIPDRKTAMQREIDIKKLTKSKKVELISIFNKSKEA